MADTRFLALTIFSLVYIILIAGENSPRKVDRPAAGLIGAVLMVACGVLNRHEAYAAIDFETLALLFGMMTLIHFATVSGLLMKAAQLWIGGSRSSRRLLWSVTIAAGVLSALFVNDTVCLLMTPLLLVMTREMNLPAEPYLLALATSSNAGSAMTLTGNPQNMLIGQASRGSWIGFLTRMAPVGIVALLINGLIFEIVYKKELKIPPKTYHACDARLDRKLAMKTVAVLAGLLLAFLLGAPMDISALAASSIMLVLANRPPKEAFDAVDWSLLLFFGGLFVIIEGVTKSEKTWLAQTIPGMMRQTDSFSGLFRFSMISVAGSNLFSNVPFVMLLKKWVSRSSHPAILWLALSASSTFAGNLTLVGSVANLIVAQKAKEECPLSFYSFLRVGVPITFLTVLASVLLLTLYMKLRLL